MKLFQIFNNMCYYDMTPLYSTLEEAQSHYPADVVIVETPDYVFESWGYDETKTDEERFIKPTAPEGWEYDENTGTFYNPTEQAKQEKIVRIAELEAQLAATDYKIIKCYEYSCVGKELPYDISALHTERQSARNEINSLQAELEELEGGTTDETNNS